MEFAYRKPGEAQSSRRCVQPYHLAHRDNLWYLIALDVERGALRTFALPRIGQVKVLAETFARPENFSPEAFFASALGVLGGEGNYEVVIRFDSAVADRVREREWHESQDMRDQADGSLELRLRLGALAEVARWVLGWGDSAEVLGPPELRDHLRAKVTRLARIYG